MVTALTSRKIYIMNEATTTYLDVAKVRARRRALMADAIDESFCSRSCDACLGRNARSLYGCGCVVGPPLV